MTLVEKMTDSLKPRKARSATITYRTTPELKKFFKQYAKQEDMNMQQLFTDALLTYLKQKREELDNDESSSNIHKQHA